MTSRIINFGVAFVVVILLTPLFRSLAVRLGLFDLPGPRKLHLRATPLLGGLGVYLAVVFGLLVEATSEHLGDLITLLLGATFLLVVGLIDDRVGLSARIKLLAAIPFAGLILAAGGIRVTAFPLADFWSGYPPIFFALSVALTVLWVVVITSAFAILDHMNGLCAGIAALASLGFFTLALSEGLVLVGILAAAMLGANLGFLRWNFRSATIFLGDTGALFIGFMISAMAILLRFSEVPVRMSWMIPLLLLWVPLFDTTLVFVSRLRRGISPSGSPGRDHTAHRISNLGFGNFGAVLSLLAVEAFFVVLGVLVPFLTGADAYWLAGLAGVLTIAGVVSLEKLPYERQGNDGEPRLSAPPEP